MVTRKESTRMFIDGVIEAGQRNLEEIFKKRQSTQEFIDRAIEVGQRRIQDCLSLYSRPFEIYSSYETIV